MTRQTGETMTKYSEENSGFFASLAAIGGRINTAVGSAIESVVTKEENGELGESLADKFIESNKIVGTAAIDSAKGESYKKNDLIRKAQSRLLDIGYNPGPVDGIMGRKTQKAISQYQLAYGLPVTGEIDNQTIASLDIK